MKLAFPILFSFHTNGVLIQLAEEREELDEVLFQFEEEASQLLLLRTQEPPTLCQKKLELEIPVGEKCSAAAAAVDGSESTWQRQTSKKNFIVIGSD